MFTAMAESECNADEKKTEMARASGSDGGLPFSHVSACVQVR